MATRTGVAAAGTIDRGPEARTVYHRIFYYVKDTNHRRRGVLVVEQFLLDAAFNVGDAVVQLAQLTVVPAVGGADEVTGNAL